MFCYDNSPLHCIIVSHDSNVIIIYDETWYIHYIYILAYLVYTLHIYAYIIMLSVTCIQCVEFLFWLLYNMITCWMSYNYIILGTIIVKLGYFNTICLSHFISVCLCVSLPLFLCVSVSTSLYVCLYLPVTMSIIFSLFSLV